jgi:hypothetical protein
MLGLCSLTSLFREIVVHLPLRHCTCISMFLPCLGTWLQARTTPSNSLEITNFWKATIAQLLIHIPIFYATLTFNTVLTKLNRVLSQMNPVHTTPTYFSKAYFNIILPPCLALSNCLLLTSPLNHLRISLFCILHALSVSSSLVLPFYSCWQSARL